MRKLDFAVQTALLAAALWSITETVFVDKGFVAWLGIFQFFTGGWQLVSALATAANEDHGNAWRRKKIKRYWLLVVIYFVVLLLLALIQVEPLLMLWFSTAWGIAIYYYIFTIRLAFYVNRPRKTFLDIVN